MKAKINISASDDIALQSKILDKEIKNIMRKLAATAKEKEVGRKKLEITVSKLAAAAKEKEVVRKKLEVTASKLAATAKEKEVGRKKLEIAKIAESEAKAKVEAMLSSISDGMIAVDNHGRVVAMSKATEKILGWRFNELNNKIFNEFVTILDEKRQVVSKENRPLYIALTTGKNIVSNNYYYVKQNGTAFPVSSFVAPIIFKGKIIGSINNFRDITNERELEKAKDEFISLASHQLNTPITAISWNMDVLLKETYGALNEKQKEILERINESSKNMTELVVGFLDVTKIESNGFAVEKGDVDLLQISDLVLDEFVSQISAKKINIVKKYGNNIPHLNIGIKTTRVIFQNLISNALKYTDEGGTVSVNIEKNTEGISIYIKDNGYGIADKDKNKIFSKLFRADNIKEKVPSGTGLGLYLIKNLVDKIGGKVWFESKEGGGTTFYVNLINK